LGGSRLSFRILSESLRRNAVANGRRVLIYGAGDKGEVALREILNNPLLGMTPVGFIDDDERKHRKRIQGYKVFGGRDRLCDIATRYAVNELVVATDKLRPENLAAAGAVCRDLGLALKSLELSIR
jgi:UDP-GlcNAc:undecaprenyl-phosphate GlcNAc-1-phosphate transferase